jgi:hypothetical protein
MRFSDYSGDLSDSNAAGERQGRARRPQKRTATPACAEAYTKLGPLSTPCGRQFLWQNRPCWARFTYVMRGRGGLLLAEAASTVGWLEGAAPGAGFTPL